MNNSIIQKIKDELAGNENIAIAVGKNPAIDEMAAALSFYLLLKKSNKKVTIASPTRPIVELSSLVGIDKVENKLESQEGDLVVSFPYVEGEIEKVSYTLENGNLNIIVKAAPQGLTFDEKDVKYAKGGGTGALSLLIVIGTPDLSDLGELITPEKLHNAKIINIDNKRDNQGFGDIVAVSSEYSSVSELVSDIVLSLGFRPDKDIAQNLLDGIIYATKNFQEDETSPLAFEIASLLMRNGARRERPVSPIRNQANTRQPQASRLDTPSSRQANPVSYPEDNNMRDNNGKQEDDQNAPNDWLGPKVYKGSSSF
jgi:hypothetical protein